MGMCRRRRMKKLRLPLILLISLFWSISCWDLDKELLRQLTREQLKMEHEELTKMNWRMNQVKKMMPSLEEDAHDNEGSDIADRGMMMGLKKRNSNLPDESKVANYKPCSYSGNKNTAKQ